ncbi:MAG: hypothetical protein TU35_009525 [Thermoproteus sp. AZ2]|uniref:Uncharacterized protein n=1 Tax=Thermoproteus sp. AZ2 TaxID=1609232 RepID=A0ACC6V346_9CREN
MPVSAVYKTYYLVQTSPPAAVNGTTQLWAPEGSTVEFTAPVMVDLGNGTRLVFRGWSSGQAGNFTVVVAGPMYITPVYTVEYLVSIEAPNNSTEVWADAGSAVVLKAPGLIGLNNGTRLVFEGWSINGKPVNSTAVAVRVTGPIAAVAQYAREYLVEFYSEYGQPQPASAWAAEGQPIYATVSPELVWAGYAFYSFAGWEGPDGQLYQPPVPAMPGRFTAVWAIDMPYTAALYGSIAAIIIGVALYIKRRRG